jgi:dTDP-4-dehydrorhamnose 3,5-epimerase-like enzyme
MQNRMLFGGKVAEIPTTTQCDLRGMLTAVQFAGYNFHAVRAFVVTAPRGTVRGGHAHRSGRQLMMRLSGEIGIELRYQERVERVSLIASDRALLIAPEVWALQTYEGENPSLLVLCDTEYDPDDYVLDPA